MTRKSTEQPMTQRERHRTQAATLEKNTIITVKKSKVKNHIFTDFPNINALRITFDPVVK